MKSLDKLKPEDLSVHRELVLNCILSCQTIGQLEIAEDMIGYFITERFSLLVNRSELLTIAAQLKDELRMKEKDIIKSSYEMISVPTLERYMQSFFN